MLFNKGNSKIPDLDIDVPDFEDASDENPQEYTKKPNFPSFDADFGTIKKQIGMPKPMQAQNRPQFQKPTQDFSNSSNMMATHASGKPIFVKLESYREAMDSINSIKSLCKEADSLLDQIHKIRSDEDRELEKWHRDLSKVKDRLLEVDRKLFES